MENKRAQVPGLSSRHASSTPSPRETRDRLIAMISAQGPITARALAEHFGLTGAAIRRHLAGLESDGVIEEYHVPATKRGRGRPSKSYVLSADAHKAQDSENEDLARLALNLLHRHGGDEAMIELSQARVEEWIREVERRTARRPEARSREQVLELLVDVLTERGYACSVRPISVPIPAVGDGHRTRTLRTAQFVQGHCPIRDIASEHPVICEVETRAISQLLGVPVQRLATLAGGAHACTTHIPLTEGRKP